MSLFSDIPTPARYFGLAGLIPFTAGAVFSWFDAPIPLVSSLSPIELLQTYGAIILSFLGGIRWGVAMQNGNLMHQWPIVGWAMVPSLLGWAGLLIDADIGLLTLMFGFVLQYVLDIQWHTQNRTPPWFLTLRTLLTAGATVCLALGWLAP